MKILLFALATVIVLQAGSASGSGTFGLNAGDLTSTLGSSQLSATRFQNTGGTGTLTKLELLYDDATPYGSVRLGVFADSAAVPAGLLLDADAGDSRKIECQRLEVLPRSHGHPASRGVEGSDSIEVPVLSCHK